MFRIILISIVGFASIFAQDLVSITNGEVAVVVDKVTGQFAIGSADGTPLIDGYPTEPYNTHLCLRMQGHSYSNEPGLADYDFVLRDSAEIYDNTISIVWNVGIRRLWEKFYTLDEDSLRGFIYIEYIFYNDAPESVYAGLLEYMDIKVGENDCPTIELPGEIIDHEMSYQHSLVPAYWTLYENYEDSLSNVAWGVPFGTEDIYVDMVSFSDVDYVHDVTWNFMGFGRAINNLATLLQWDELPIEPYGWYRTGHYYGLGYPGVGIEEMLGKLNPTSIVFGAPYPNPTNGAIRINVDVIDHPQNVRLDIFAIDGKQVAQLCDKMCNIGKHTFRWNLTDTQGKPVPSGVYIARLLAGRTVWNRSVVVVR